MTTLTRVRNRRLTLTPYQRTLLAAALTIAVSLTVLALTGFHYLNQGPTP